MVLIKLMKIPPIRHLLGGHSLSPVVTSPLHTDTKRITKYNCRQCHITLNTDEKSESYEIQIQWSRAMRCIYIFLVTGVASCSLVSVSRFSCVKLFFISVTISILAQGLVTKVSNFQSEDAIDNQPFHSSCGSSIMQNGCFLLFGRTQEENTNLFFESYK